MKHLITLEIPAATAQQAVVRLRALARSGRIEEFVTDICAQPSPAVQYHCTACQRTSADPNHCEHCSKRRNPLLKRRP